MEYDDDNSLTILAYGSAAAQHVFRHGVGITGRILRMGQGRLLKFCVFPSVYYGKRRSDFVRSFVDRTRRWSEQVLCSFESDFAIGYAGLILAASRRPYLAAVLWTKFKVKVRRVTRGKLSAGRKLSGQSRS